MTISVHRSQLIWTPLVGWALLACSLSPAYAQAPAQDIDDTGDTPAVTAPGTTTTGGKITPGSLKLPSSSDSSSTTTTSGAPPVVLPNTVQALPSYQTTIVDAPFGTTVPVSFAPGVLPPIVGGDELGITMGSFRLYPSIELNVGYDDNVFAQSATLGTVGSMYWTVAPALDLRSDWLNHELHLLIGGVAGFYAATPTQNYQNFTAQADGKIDIRTDFYATWLIAFRQSTEALGTPNVSFAQAPTVVNSIPVQVGLYQRFNRFFYEFRAGATKYSYTDYSTIQGTGLPGTSRDRTEYDESVRLGYEISDDVSLFVQPGLNQRRYLNQTNSADQERNSDGQTLGVGGRWAFTPTTFVESTVGYASQIYSGGLGTTSGVTYGLTGSWNGYDPLTLRPSITRAINETALSNYKSFLSTTYAVDINYLIHDAWTAVGGISYTTADYQPVDGLTGVPQRTDSFFRGQIGLLYSIRPQVQFGPSFEYTQGSSTDPLNGPSFQREIFSLRLIAKR